MSATPRRSPDPDQPAIPRLSLSLVEAACSIGVALEFFEQHVLPALQTVAVGDQLVVPTAELQRWLNGGGKDAKLTLAEVAEEMKVSERTVLRAIRAGDLAASQLYRRGGWRIYESAMRDWMELRAVTPRRSSPAPPARRIDPVPRQPRGRPSAHGSTGRLIP